MWERIWNHLPDLRPGTLEIRDVVSLVVGSLGAYLAYLAIRMGREQEKHSKRQAEIIETQHQFMLEQRAKRPELHMTLTRPSGDHWDGKTFVLGLMNTGTKNVNGFYWHFLIPDDRRDSVRFEWDKPGLKLRHTVDHRGQPYWYYNGYSELPIFPGRSGRIGALIADRKLLGDPIRFKWHISTEDGEFPIDDEEEAILLDPSDPEWDT